MTYGEDAIRIAETIDHPYQRVAAYSRVGNLHLRQGDVDKAIPFLEDAYTLSQKSDISLFFRIASAYLACAYARSGRMADTLFLLEAISEPSREYRLVGEYRLAYIETCFLVGQVTDAYRSALHALSEYRALNTPGRETWVLWLLGEIAMRRHSPDITQAEAHYQQAFALANKLGIRPLVAHCHYGLGAIYGQIEPRQRARPEPA